MDPNLASLGEAPKNSLQQHSPEVTSLPIGKKGASWMSKNGGPRSTTWGGKSWFNGSSEINHKLKYQI